MYVVVLHQFTDPPTAFARGEKLVMNEDAPPGVRGLQFYPSSDGSVATCLWESDSLQAVQEYVDTTLGDSSVHTCYEVDAEQAFAEQPLGLRSRADITAWTGAEASSGTASGRVRPHAERDGRAR